MLNQSHVISLKQLFTKRLDLERDSHITNIIPHRCNFEYEKKFGWTEFKHTITKHYPHWIENHTSIKELLKVDPYTITSDDKVIFKGEHSNLIQNLF